MTPITLPSGKYLIVDVPEGATDFVLEIDTEESFFMLEYYIQNLDEDSGFYGEWGTEEIELAPGSYTLIGVDPLNLTEDEWKVVVRQYHNGYENYYSQMVSLHLTATESGSSLLTAHGHKQGSAVILKVND